MGRHATGPPVTHAVTLHYTVRGKRYVMRQPVPVVQMDMPEMMDLTRDRMKREATGRGAEAGSLRFGIEEL